MLNDVEWGEFRIGDIFILNGIKQAKSQKLIPTDNSKSGIPYVVQSLSNNMIARKVNRDWLIDNNEPPIKGNCIVLGVTLPAVSYQPVEFGASQVITARATWLNNKNGPFLAIAISKIMYKFSYDNKPGIKIYKNTKIKLPIRNGNIDFSFIEQFIERIEQVYIQKLDAYLTPAGLKDCHLTEKEKEVLTQFETWQWGEFNLKELFGNATRGKRLKSADRIAGDLPFVTAGEAEEGVSAFIGNAVHIFSENTITIDMFGSAKYRNYKYGGDDHIAVVHTEKLPKGASVFVTSAIHKSSYAGQFSYSRNFYAKDADELNILLPIQNNQPDYESMHTFISAVQKLVVHDVVGYVAKRSAKL